jgi:galactose mutarotase-like enzyme
MFNVTHHKDPIESLELRDEEAGSQAVLAPERGGLLTRLVMGGRHVFFLDEATLRDTTKNVRGGNPVLFPAPGKLRDNAYQRDGKHGSMPQHGFARNFAWEVASTSAEGAARATLRLASSDTTRAAYPWDFVAEYTYALRGPLLRIDLAFTNTGSERMPFGAGFHPYFLVRQSEKGDARVHTTATRAFDNVTKTSHALERIDLTLPEVDMHLQDHGPLPCTLEWPGGRIVVRGSPEFTHWVIWTLSGKDFVCVEPWTCPGDALNTGDRLITLAPSETRRLWVEYALGSPS